MARGSDWSDEELELIVADYFDMLSDELASRPYVKAEHRRALQPRLDGRTEGSIEFKHQNISAWLIEQGLPYIDGYKPLHHYQASIGRAVREHLRRFPQLLGRFEALVTQLPKQRPAADAVRAVEPPVPLSPDHALPPREEDLPDLVALHELQSELGRAGEELVLEWERARLREAGAERLADAVEWVAQTRGPIAGFDILSFEPDGAERLIEVKTTNYGRFYPFYLSANELATSRRRPQSYRLYRLFDFSRRPGLYRLAPPLEAHCRLEPAVYRASF